MMSFIPVSFQTFTSKQRIGFNFLHPNIPGYIQEHQASLQVEKKNRIKQKQEKKKKKIKT